MSRAQPAQPFRLASGGALIDRGAPLSFTFDGRSYRGYAGDTLASALLANGVQLLARSFKYHRPRGVFSAGSEEPNALVTLGVGARSEPNTRATTVELFDALAARSQNAWPGLRLDLGAVNGLFAPLLSAGFYYKTFMWPAGAWLWYEKFIRRAAGMGRASEQADPDRYETGNAFCDVLVVGAGPAGLAAAHCALQAGLSVTLVDEHPAPGGALRAARCAIGGEPASQWLARAWGQLTQHSGLRWLARTTAFAYYDGNCVALLERVADHRAAPRQHEPRQRVWLLRARKVILATGAIERPLVFANNDLPGIMLAAALREYCNGYGVLPGRRIVVATNNDSAYQTACDLADAGGRVLAVVDARAEPGAAAARALEQRAIALLRGQVVTRAAGGRALRAVQLAATGGGAATGSIACDLLALSGGWSPALHLQSQRGIKARFDPALDCFVAGADTPECLCAGALGGVSDSAAALADGLRAGQLAAAQLGAQPGAQRADPGAPFAPAQPQPQPEAAGPLLPLGAGGGKRADRAKAFIDLQTDVTEADVALAHREGFVSVEHLKRYTTLGMGTDQGKTGNLNGMAAMAGQRGLALPAVGSTRFRPPYTPVAIGALAGAAVGAHLRPVRRTPMHDWHVSRGAQMTEAGLWLRPWFYRSSGADVERAYVHEMTRVRAGVGMVDVSTLGKIDVQGPDAAQLLERVYVNGWSKLAVGRARYGLMLRDDGFVFDDGTTARLAEQHFFMTTTTANAAAVLSRLEFLLDTAWPDLRVHLTSVTDQWGALALAGPLSRQLLCQVLDGALDNAALPHMGVANARFGALPLRVHRVSFSGELAYEVYCPANDAQRLWERLYEQGQALGLVAYGTEAMGALRVEKGHAAGPEIDGRTTLDDLGLGRMAKATPFAGSVLSRRAALCSAQRQQLVGLRPEDPAQRLRPGAILFAAEGPVSGHGLGHVTSTTYSPTLRAFIALGLLAQGRQSIGRRLRAVYPIAGESVALRVVDPVFLDPQGERLRA